MLVFYVDDFDCIIFNGMRCYGFQCQEVIIYIIDGFKIKGKVLWDDMDGCWWVKGLELFMIGEDDFDKDCVICIVRDKVLFLKQDQCFKILDNFFKGIEEVKNI